MKKQRRVAGARVIGTLLPLVLAAVLPALAISDEEIFRDFPFNLINPGARAISVGGAFISQADDSTAAQANPAGLMTLRRPELFVELRSSRNDSTSTAVDATLDTLFFQGYLGAGAVSDPESEFSPAFLSYVIPFRRVALGFSRLESLNARTRTLNSFEIDGQEAIVEVDPVSGDRTIIGYQPVDFELTAEADLDARVVQWNVAFAAELHRRFFLGVTGVLGTADMNGRVDNLFRDRTAGPGDPFSGTTLDYSTRINDSDTDFAFNAGLLWRPADWASIGAVYRQGLRFVLDERISDMGVRAAQAQELYGSRFVNVFHTPDSYGMGMSFRPAEPWTLLFDAVHVEYSDLLDGYRGGLNRISFPAEDEEFTVDDGTEYHAGIERIFLAGTTPVAIRFGAWSDPDHRIRAAESDGNGLLAVFPEGERVTHYTAGFGVTLKEKIQLDFAADVSSVSSTFVFSTIYRF